MYKAIILITKLCIFLQGLIVALLSVGCLIGALMGGFISDLAGRKPAVILGASLVAAGGMLHTGAINLWLA
jgi:MFS family permease